MIEYVEIKDKREKYGTIRERRMNMIRIEYFFGRLLEKMTEASIDLEECRQNMAKKEEKGENLTKE